MQLFSIEKISKKKKKKMRDFNYIIIYNLDITLTQS